MKIKRHQGLKNSILVLLMAVGIFLSCAKQGMPPGGPEDKTPPEVISTIPANGSIHVVPGDRVEFTFSEYVRPVTASDAVFVSPFPGDDLKLKWRGRKLIVQFPKPFPENRTIVVTLGTAIQDEQNNPLASSFTLAFSTGDHLDDHEIKGKVYGSGSLRGVGIWAYGLDVNPDPDPSEIQPDYAAQCDEQGAFRLSHLPAVSFRVFSVRDKVLDRLFQSDEDEIGIPSRDVHFDLTSLNRMDSLFFRTTRIDTTGPSLTGASSLGRNRIVLRFDEPIVLDSCRTTIISVRDSLDTLALANLYLDPNAPNTAHGLTPDQQDVVYQIRMKGLTDLNGNPALTDTIRFNGNADPDTTRPKVVSISPVSNNRNVPLDIHLRWVFSVPMDSSAMKTGFQLRDTSEAVAGTIKWKSPVEMSFVPDRLLAGRTEYRCEVIHAGSLWGLSMPDTTIRFRTMDPDTLSEISGKIDAGMKKDRIIVQAKQTPGSETAYTQTTTDQSAYRFPAVLPGLYLIDFFLDSDGNGKWNPGFPFPFQPSEAVYQPSDTIRVRSRWPNEGNDFKLP